jgi:anti-sigma factor RsiW
MARENHEDDLLHRYLDGDLARSDAERVKERLAREPAATTKVAAVRELGDLIRASAKAPDISSDDLWARIANQTVAPSAKPAAPAATVLQPNAAARARWKVPAAVSGALAAAAVFALYVGRQAPAMPDEAPILVAEAPEEAAEVPDPASAWERMERTEVVDVEFGKKSGALFTIDTEEGESLAVLWLTEDDEGGLGFEPSE